jgi:hypothetical protein
MNGPTIAEHQDKRREMTPAQTLEESGPLSQGAGEVERTGDGVEKPIGGIEMNLDDLVAALDETLAEVAKEPTDRALKEEYCLPSRAIDKVHHLNSPPKSPYLAFPIPLPTNRQHDALDEIAYRQKPCCVDVLGLNARGRRLVKPLFDFVVSSYRKQYSDAISN